MNEDIEDTRRNIGNPLVREPEPVGGVANVDANSATKSVYNTDAGVARQFEEADTTSSVRRVWV